MFAARHIALAVLGLAPFATACKKDEASAKGSGSGSSIREARPEACGGPREVTGAIGWIEDDFDRARGCATERKQPLVVDLWAPWCHTCLSMKAYIFSDPSLKTLADRFVFLAADTDKDENAELVEAYPPAAWPTFYVLSPDGKVAGRFVGAASVDQFRDFLVESEQAFLGGATLADGPLRDLVGAEEHVRAAARTRDKAVRASELEAAIGGYRHALETAPADWPRRPDVLVATLSAIARSQPPDACVTFALEHLDKTGTAASATDFWVTASGCADKLEMDAPAPVQELRERAAARLAAQIADAAAPLSVDDRSDAMANLRELYTDLGRPTEALAMAEQQRALLDQTAATIKDPFVAMTYNWPRSEVYAFLQKHAELVPALEKSAADLPQEYDPPYRLAWLHKDAGNLDEALTWCKKAVALTYGPRKAKAQQMLVDILRAQGNAAAEIAARKELIAIYEGLPEAQVNPDTVDQARVELAALEAVEGQ